MAYLLHNEQQPQEVAYIDYAPNFGRFTHTLDDARAPIADAILRLELARELLTYDPTEDISSMLPDLISSEFDDE